MHVDPLLPGLVLVLFVILLVAFGLRALRQPYVVGYLIAGVLVGPAVTGLITDIEMVGHLGSMGVVLLMFFVGMEISPQRLVASWRVAVLGTALQVVLSVGCVFTIGWFLDWPVPRCIVLGFVISLSSTAVVIKLLKDWSELDTAVGNNVLVVLLAQDLAIIPMLAVIGALGEGVEGGGGWLSQGIGGVFIVLLCARLVRGAPITLPFVRSARSDHELQVFVAAALALGLAMVTGMLGLSTALGAFVAGMLVASARETEWVHRSLEPFRVVLVAVFFVSVGVLIDLEFLWAHWWQTLLLVAAVLATNNLINSLTLRMLGDSWRESFYAGAMLAQVGEFSFLLASVGLQAGIIEQFGYQMTIAVITLSLIFSPAWIALIRRFTLAAPAA